MTAAQKPIRIDGAGTSIVVTVSIGISLMPQDSDKAEDLISNSDRAMYMAKKSGKNQYAFYSKQ